MKIFRFTFYILFIILPCCESSVSEDFIETSNPLNNGMIQGKVTVPDVEDNIVIRNGIKGADVSVLNTDFSTVTTENGIYAIDGIPEGRYTVEADVSALEYFGFYDAGTQAVIVNKQKVSTVPDIELSLGFLKIIVYGKIYYKDKITPYSNKRIELYQAAIISSTGEYVPSTLVTSTITSANGDFAFYLDFYENYLLHNSENSFNWLNPTSAVLGTVHGITKRDACVK